MKAIAILFLAVFQFMLQDVAQAQFDLGTNPEQPTADVPTEFLATFTGCPPQPVENIDGLSYELRVNDFEIDFFFAVRFGVPCGVPPEGPSLAFNMGVLPQGDYTLRAAGTSDLESFPADMTGLEPILFEFTVGKPTAQAIPALSTPAIVILALLMMSGLMLFARNSRIHAMTRN